MEGRPMLQQFSSQKTIKTFNDLAYAPCRRIFRPKNNQVKFDLL